MIGESSSAAEDPVRLAALVGDPQISPGDHGAGGVTRAQGASITHKPTLTGALAGIATNSTGAPSETTLSLGGGNLRRKAG
ncbi:MAG: hypothetical protein ACLQIQ_19635 [Beijerinckiaceae bacterium]